MQHEIGTHLTLKPSQLSPHPKLATHPYDHGTLMQMVGTIPTTGVLEELLITSDGQILNGRHRWKGAINAGLATKEILPCKVVDEADADNIILTTLGTRKNYSRSAVAYLAGPHIIQAIARAKEIRKQVLRGKATDSFTGAEGSSFADIADMVGVSEAMIKLAANTHALFAASDKKITEWLAKHLDAAEEWQTFQDEADLSEEQRPSWQAWRAKWLTDNGHNPNDSASVAIIPESYREIYEAKIFTVEPGEGMGLGAINKAVGSALNTKGEKRNDLKPENPALHLTLAKKVDSFHKTTFAHWHELELNHRAELAAQIAEAATQWPAEVQAELLAQLKAAKK